MWPQFGVCSLGMCYCCKTGDSLSAMAAAAKQLVGAGQLISALIASDMAHLGWVGLPDKNDWRLLLGGSGGVEGLNLLLPESAKDKRRVEMAEALFERLQNDL